MMTKLPGIKTILTLIAMSAITSTSFAQMQSPPAGFIENKGQIVNEKQIPMPEINFKVEQQGLNAYFKPDGIVYHLYKSEKKDQKEYTREDWDNYHKGDVKAIGENVYFFRMDFELIGSNKNAEVIRRDLHKVKRNYYLAHCPQGILNVQEYGEIIYQDVYPNIDLRYYYKNNQLKYEFIVYPGGDPSQIKFRYNGSTNTSVNGEELSVENIYSNLKEGKPYTYTEERTGEIENSFEVNDGIVSFRTGEYDRSSTLIIDPSVTWATYYNNGSSSDFHCNSAFDANGKIYSAFATYTATWPTVNAGAGQYYDAVKDGITDLIILGFNADYSVQWVTYYGGTDGDYLCGTGGDYGKTIGVDQNNNVYVGGYTNYAAGVTFPTQSSIFPGSFYQDQTHIYGGDNPFLLKFDANGVRQWATIYNHEQANTNSAGLKINGICVSGTKVYFTGMTYKFNSNDIPLRNLAGAYYQSTFLGAQDCFIGRFNDQCVLEWSTYFNSGTVGQAAYKDGADVHVDASGNLLLVGHATGGGSNTSAYLLNPGGGAYYQSTITGSIDVYIAKFNTSLQPVWATYYGGNDLDRVSEVSSDASGNVLVACRIVNSNTFPVLNPGGSAYYQGTKPSTGTNSDGGIMKFNSSGVRQWATYVGATTGNNNSVTGIGADASGNVYAIGYTAGNNLTVMSEAGSYNQGTSGGGNDLFYMKFNGSSVLQWSSYYGGTGSETCYGVKLATASTGCYFKQFNFFATNSTSLPTTNPGSPALYQTTPSTANANACILFTTTSGVLSTDPTSVSSTPVNNCTPGFNTNISVVGGSLGTGANWQWYTSSCGGTSIGSGTTINVSPAVATTYYVRAEGTCNTSACASLTVTPPTQVTANITSSSNVLCFGGSTGSATVTPGGGTGSYTYGWLPSGGSAATAGSLSANTYTVTVTDGNSCSATSTITISQNSVVTASASNTGNVSCFNGTNGSALVTPGGGTGSYTYSWSPSGGTAASATGLSANTYTVTVTDGNLCSATGTVNITQPASAVSANITASADVSCFGGNDASATVTAGGGASGYTYSWSPSGGTGSTATGLTSGGYTVTVTDANSCTQTATVTLTQPTALDCSAFVVAPPSSATSNDGSISVNTTGGTLNYNYSWSPSGGSSVTATGLSSGPTYTVTVTDANGCTCTSTASFGNVGIENNEDISLNIYPNPGDEYLQVQINGAFNATDTYIKVFDMAGKQLFVLQLVNPIQIVDMSKFASGIYLVNIYTNEKLYTKKWIKK
jgi:hypothetical protein